MRALLQRWLTCLFDRRAGARRAVVLVAATLPGLLPASSVAESAVARGEYLTTILGCGGCHTEGALLGQPTGPWLAGSLVGIAYSNYDEAQSPALVFPRNLTSDPETGLGNWSKADIVRAIRSGLNHQREMMIPVMPWPNYSLLREQDVEDIAAYLKSLPAVSREIPARVEAADDSRHPYIRIGVFIFDPAEKPAE
ncbi:MAG: c-type cytochrome [Pseudomonadales bacterium]|nr:c-type cytochrome [Pseudomonadales bacterium]MCP5182652.1 c-type cytochrome [Pseudomonadales bacterium]